jgi:hypothetical protein
MCIIMGKNEVIHLLIDHCTTSLIVRCRCIDQYLSSITHHTPRYKLANLYLHPLPPKLHLETNHRSNKPQNCPTPCKHVLQGHHVTLVETLPMFIHFSTPIGKNYRNILTTWPYAQLGHIPHMSIQFHLFTSMQ